MGRGQSVMIRFGTMDRTFIAEIAPGFLMTSCDHCLHFTYYPRRLCIQLFYTFLMCTLWRPGGLVFNAHINFDEVVCNNKRAVSTNWSPQLTHPRSWVSPLRKQFLVAVVMPAKVSAAPHTWEHWKLFRNRLRMFQAHLLSVSVSQLEVRDL